MMIPEGSKILFVMAHPDDELLWGWPLLQNPAYEKRVLHCVSDEHNPVRRDIAHRKDVAAALCRDIGVAYENLGLDSDFYLTPQYKHRRRRTRLQKIFPFLMPPRPTRFLCEVAQEIADAVARTECDYVFTHNFWGEYGHMDHILVNTIVFNTCTKPIIVSDARIAMGWFPLTAADRMPAANRLASCVLDKAFYDRCAAHYINSGTWTWDRASVDALDLYLFPGQQN